MDTKLYIDDFDRLSNHRYTGDSYDVILKQPRAFWFGWGKYSKKKLHGNSVKRLLNRAGNDIVTLVLYNIPNRDLSSFSSGGCSTYDEYTDYVDDFCNAIDRECIVIVEPDALSHSVKLDDPSERYACLIYAVENLLNTRAKVYIDVGHPDWLSPAQVAKILMQSETDIAHGFSVNVSNFISTQICVPWAEQVSHLTGGLGYVIDTSRNGADVDGWCNPQGAKLGERPTTITNIEGCDAFLWIKPPGESDGHALGAPRAGSFYPEFAKRLINV